MKPFKIHITGHEIKGDKLRYGEFRFKMNEVIDDMKSKKFKPIILVYNQGEFDTIATKYANEKGIELMYFEDLELLHKKTDGYIYFCEKGKGKEFDKPVKVVEY